MKIRKGDHVKIMSGKDRGKTGTVLTAFPLENKIVVEGLNMFKKRSRPKRQGETGQIVQVARPMPASKAQIVCANCKSPTRVGYRVETNGHKARFCKKCQANL
ncbi:MAG TPA: 50S ribosomal protein L24 [Candidatus Paceibacterota bacterium]|nr:50S ribosomal protein L24 [Candidatus Paceibacterota bacterium]